MRAFAKLYSRLDSTTKTNRKLAAMLEYFSSAEPADAAWAVYFLSGRKPKRLLLSRNLAAWAYEAAGLPDWLFGECYYAVGDFAETMALLLPPPNRLTDEPLHRWVEGRLLPLRQMSEARQREEMLRAWDELGAGERFVWNKLLTGEFRVGVSQRLVVRALAETAKLPAATIAHRLMGFWEPTPDFFVALTAPEVEGETDESRPYPFFLAHPLESDPRELGPRADWLAEWKWDGIRAQLIRRNGQTYIWSRGEELVTERFPELLPEAALLPDGTALDGEILAWKDGVLPFARLQRRIGRKSVGRKSLEEAPVALLSFDLLELAGRDIRQEPLVERRRRLEELLGGKGGDSRLLVSPTAEGDTWDDLERAREASRERRVEGLMLKRLDSPYGVGRERGPWWKWKIAPYTVDCVMIYAQRGHGRRASLYTDYTFGVWHEGELTPFAKAYSGLTDEEIRQVDRWVRLNTLERYGPVRAVKPEQVFELAFEGIQRSTRHKSGVAVRFPRMHRWRRDKRPEDADSLATVLGMIRE